MSIRLTMPEGFTLGAELNGSTAIFVNVTVGSDRDDHTAVRSVSGSAGFYAGAGCHSE
jgi:hypothetical protein